MSAKREAVPASLVPVLEMLHRLEGASLFRYLADSPSYVSPQAGRWMPVLKKMGEASHARLAALEIFLDDGVGTTRPVHYPSHFASLHYLSLTYLRGRLMSDKQALAAGYAQAVQSMEGEAESAVTRFIQDVAATHKSDLAILQALSPQ